MIPAPLPIWLQVPNKALKGELAEGRAHVLTDGSGLCSGILIGSYWHVFWHLICRRVWRVLWHMAQLRLWYVFWHCLSSNMPHDMFRHMPWYTVVSDEWFGTLYGKQFGIKTGISLHPFWHTFWQCHSTWLNFNMFNWHVFWRSFSFLYFGILSVIAFYLAYLAF